MIPEVAAKLLGVNRQFYQTFAVQFSHTRQRLQPGVRRVLETFPQTASFLDLGCGNGELARALAQRGQRGLYVGLDYSVDMLAEAKKLAEARRHQGETQPGQAEAQGELSPAGFHSHFLHADLADPAWHPALRDAGLPSRYDFVLAFAVLHHLPGDELRQTALRGVRDCLAPGGRFILSNWQFLNSARLRERIQPWESVGLQAEDVEPGDYLLDWREGGSGLRYAHQFTAGELRALAQETGFAVDDSFLSDGKEGNLGLYQVWKKIQDVDSRR